MSDSLRDKWNLRYHTTTTASDAAHVLVENNHLLPSQGVALDLACGLGANALLLARHGLTVDAWDISDVAIDKLSAAATEHRLPIAVRCCDLLTESLPLQHYDVIVISRFLERDLCSPISNALKPGGLLFYQTWTVEKLGQEGPNNPHYLLQPNELLTLFAPLRVVVYREEGRIGNLGRGMRSEALLVAQRPA